MPRQQALSSKPKRTKSSGVLRVLKEDGRARIARIVTPAEEVFRGFSPELVPAQVLRQPWAGFWVQLELNVGNLLCRQLPFSMQKDRKLTPWLDTDLASIEGEDWRDVVGYGGIYNVSNYGRVKSLKRLNSVGKTIRERILRYRIHPKNRDSAVMLYADTVGKTHSVMVLVAEAFSIKKAANQVYIHENKNLSDNRAHNIIVGSRSESCLLDRKVGGWLASTKPVGTGSKNRAADHRAAFGVFNDGELVAKRCKTCRIEHPLAQYQRTGGILVHTCKTCAASAAGVKEVGKGAHYKALSKAGLRKCSRCDAVKPLEEFGKDKTAALGRKRRCKACTQKAPEPTRPRPAHRAHRGLAAGVPGRVESAPSLGSSNSA